VAYADDVVLLAEKEEEDEMRSMSRLEEYVDRKRLELNLSKTRY